MNTDLTPAPTPRVDAEACNPHNLCLENNKADYRGRKDEIVDEVVSASFARGLERELLAAHKTAEELAGALREEQLKTQALGAVLAKCFHHLGREIQRNTLNETAEFGTQELSMQIAKTLDSVNV